MYRWRQMSWSKQILVVIFKEQMKEVLFVLRNLDLLMGSLLLLHRIPKSRNIAAFGQKNPLKVHLLQYPTLENCQKTTTQGRVATRQ